MSGDPPSRRDFLSLIGASGIIGLSGCSETAENPTATPASNVADSISRTLSPSSTPTPVDDVAPSIIGHEALPEDYGTKLNVLLRGVDNREIAYAAISYGDRILEAEPAEPEVELDGVLEEIPGAEPTFPGRVVYTLQDAAGNKTEKTAYADEKAPTLTVVPSTTQNAGELELLLEGADEVGLHELRTALNSEPALTEDVVGQKEVSLQEILTSDQYGSITPGKMNGVEADLEDAMGNKSRKLVDQYVRKYDVMEDTYADIGGDYAPFAGQAMFRCISEEEWKPEIGQYGKPFSPFVIPPKITSKHIDQMTGHGINRVIFEYEGLDRSKKHLKNFLESDLSNQIDFETVLTHVAFEHRKNKSWKGEIVPEHFDFLSNHLSDEHVATYQGRPILKVWSVPWYVANDRPKRIIRDEWGGYKEFVEDLRNQYDVDGKEPFMVAGTGSVGAEMENVDEWGWIEDMVTQFDAATTWTARALLQSGETIPWETAFPYVERNYKRTRQFTDENDMEFIPIVFPGFNDGPISDGCWGENRRIPRSQDYFRKMLNLANQYKTTDMIDIATYNGVEGHQIEPGSFRGNDYGTEYLEIVREFQTPVSQ